MGVFRNKPLFISEVWWNRSARKILDGTDAFMAKGCICSSQGKQVSTHLAEIFKNHFLVALRGSRLGKDQRLDHDLQPAYSIALLSWG